MARVTVEDCIDKVESPYELVLVAKERATQLNSGLEPTLDRDNDKNTVISLREIAEEKIKVKDLTDAAVYKLRKHVEQIDDTGDEEEEIGDDFENLYKGEISKSGIPILPSKRARKIPEKIQVSNEDLAELQNTNEPSAPEPSESLNEDGADVSLDEIKEDEAQADEQVDQEGHQRQAPEIPADDQAPQPQVRALDEFHLDQIVGNRAPACADSGEYGREQDEKRPDAEEPHGPSAEGLREDV